MKNNTSDTSFLTAFLRVYYPATSDKVDALLASNKLFRQLSTSVYKKLEDSVQKYVDVAERITVLLQIISAWRNQEYRDISYANIVISASVLLYFVSPVDIIPDFIPFIGRLEDEFLLKKGLAYLDIEIEKFNRWKTKQ